MKSIRLSIVAVCAVLLATTASAQSRDEIIIPSPAGPRRALIEAFGPGPHPTVIVLHGTLGTGSGTALNTGFSEAAAQAEGSGEVAGGLTGASKCK